MGDRDWSEDEVQALVEDYFDMLVCEGSGIAYSKAEHRRDLQEHLSGRTVGSIEFKHMNVSGVLQDLGLKWLPGYAPAKNYQAILAEAVKAYLAENPGWTASVQASTASAPLGSPASSAVASSGATTLHVAPSARPIALRGQISWNEYSQNALARKELPRRIRGVSGSEASDLAVAELTAGGLAHLVFVSDWRVTDLDSPSTDRRGYQRPLAATRLSTIARYIAESDGRHLFPPIILSVRHVHARQREEFLDLLRAGNIAGIHNRWGNNTVCAVDGQHRMGGALHAALSDHPDLDRVYYAAMFYFDLDYVTEAKWFATINSTSKPVPRSLVEWTKVDITEAEAETPEQQIRRIAQRLAEEGPWKEAVNFGGGYAAGRHITFEGLRRATQDMFGGVVPGSSHLPRFADPYLFACHFWEAVAELWPEAWNAKPDAPEKYRLRELVGLAALAKACAWMTRHGITLGYTGTRLEDYVLERLGRLKSFRWLKTIDSRHSDVYDIGSGFAGQGPLAERLYQRSEARG